MYTKYISAGLAVAPATANKTPAIKSWLHLQHRLPTAEEVCSYPVDAHSTLVACGEGSGNLEVLDFDTKHQADAFTDWLGAIPDELKPSKFNLPLVQTRSGGYHLYYRLEPTDMRPLEGNLKLARNNAERPETTIETRGQGGYVIAPPSPGYRTVRGTLANIPIISWEVRDIYHNTARALDLAPSSVYARAEKNMDKREFNSSSPVDIFDKTADWLDILTPHGWHSPRKTSRGTLLTRPGKKYGVSAEVRAYGDHEVLIMYTSNASPFEPGQYYTKFFAHSLLNFNGDMRAARVAIIQKIAWQKQ